MLHLLGVPSLLEKERETVFEVVQTPGPESMGPERRGRATSSRCARRSSMERCVLCGVVSGASSLTVSACSACAQIESLGKFAARTPQQLKDIGR